jgi:hypothetical protein
MSLAGSSSSSRNLSSNGNVKKGSKKRGPQVRHPRGEAPGQVGTRDDTSSIFNTGIMVVFSVEASLYKEGVFCVPTKAAVIKKNGSIFTQS